MARTPKNPNVERVAPMPFDKDDVSPLPQIAPRARSGDAGTRTSAADAPAPAAAPPPPSGREEYPGPQTSSSGTHVEPGRVRPTKQRDR